MKNALLVLLVLSFFAPLNAEAKLRRHLTAEELDRVKEIKQSIGDVEKKPLPQLIHDLENAPHPEINLTIKEAIAKTYVDIVKEESVKGQSKKEWLYSMIALNMAYFQFGGDKDSAGGVKNLNKLIRYKLKAYLPSDIFKNPAFYSDLG